MWWTDRPMDWRNDKVGCRVACTRLETIQNIFYICFTNRWIGASFFYPISKSKMNFISRKVGTWDFTDKLALCNLNGTQNLDFCLFFFSLLLFFFFVFFLLLLSFSFLFILSLFLFSHLRGMGEMGLQKTKNLKVMSLENAIGIGKRQHPFQKCLQLNALKFFCL